MNWLSWIKGLAGNKNKGMGGNFPGIVAAKVLEISKHPNADRLRLVKLDAGHLGIVGPVVCGASNFSVGNTVALAMPGAVIARNIHSEQGESFTLEKATIRGVQSQGMICAAYELGLAAEPGQGIMILPDNPLPGKEFTRTML